MAEAEPLPDVIAVALDFSQRLAALAVPFVVGGSLASSVHGEPRSTLDVDLVVGLRPQDVEPLLASVRPTYYLDADVLADAVRTAGTVNAVHLTAGIKVDLFVAGADPFEAERLRQRVAVPVGPGAADLLWVDTPEHTILRKLEWYRRGGEQSDRQWRDVRAIAAVQGEALDWGLLSLWSGHLGVVDLVQRLWLEQRDREG